MQQSVLEYLYKTAGDFPEKTAIVCSEGTMTFSEMRRFAQNLGCAIHNRINTKKSVPILIYLPKSARSVTSFLGVLYSGNFYTPTDVTFPFSKVQSVIDALCPALIISDNIYSEKLQDNGIAKETILNIDDIDLYDEIKSTNEDFIRANTDVAYVLFTSGSTGVPKGVIISHKSIINYIDWARKLFNVNPSDIIGNQAPFYFDNSVLDIYLMLSTGATMHIIPDTCFSFPKKLLDYVALNNINMVFWVPSVFSSVANLDLLSKIDANTLNKILFAGEVMPNKVLNYWKKYIPNARFANLYGPTEITVDCTCYVVDREFADDEPLPIGRSGSVTNAEILLLKDRQMPVTAPNEMGEICVRGIGLALGYWNNPEKTAEAFIQNPLNTAYTEIIYCTGDLAHYNENDELMFDGRADSQIKHLGYRIELGEIETAVLGIPGINEACVLYDLPNKEILLVYSGEEAVDNIFIRKNLFQKIPKYMIPTRYEKMSVIPKNDNGKLDRKALKELFITR